MQRLCLICYLYLRIQPGEPVPGIADRELLASRAGACVAVHLPGGREASHLVETPDACRKAVPHGAADLDLRHVQPAPVPGRVTGLEARASRSASPGGEASQGDPHGVRVRVVTD